MSADVHALATWLQPLIGALQPAARRGLAAHIARELRRANQASMRAQQSPDGQAWEARRARITAANSLRAGAARARQRTAPMMVKLRQARYLPTTATPDEAALTFAGRVLRIARVHQFGLPDRVAPGGPQHVYAERPLIGLSEELTDNIKRMVIEHLTAAVQKK